ncbi:MAG TPA: hypothetical protein VKX49_23895 [Bryobacteraceae bacterium]|nr:hypothetical protein [Bryobacteraceae bacterium]
MGKTISNVPVTNSSNARFGGLGAGLERFGFVYVVISAVAVTLVMTFTSIAGLGWPHRVLMLVGLPIVGCAIFFSALEMRRLAQSDRERAEETLDLTSGSYPAGAAVVEPPTGEGCPHHEDHPESPGLDQGQLTSHLPDNTPLIDTFFEGRIKS